MSFKNAKGGIQKTDTFGSIGANTRSGGSLMQSLQPIENGNPGQYFHILQRILPFNNVIHLVKSNRETLGWGGFTSPLNRVF